MSKILTILKCIKGVAGLIIGILIIAFVLNFLRDRSDPGLIPSPQEADHKIIEETYREPIVSLPWQKDKAPIKEEKLPIPKKRVDKVIQIETRIPGSDKVIITEIIIDKKGGVYKALDTPDDTKIKVTKYRPRLIDLDLHFGGSVVFSDQMYYCLSFDYLRIWKFHLGSEFGIAQSRNLLKSDHLIGLSVKYGLCSIGKYDPSGNSGSGVQLSLVVGWNLTGDAIYGGFNVKW